MSTSRFACLIATIVVLGAAPAHAQTKPSEPQPVPASTLESNRALVREYNQLSNAGEWRKASELLGTDFTHHSGTSGNQLRSRTGMSMQHAAIEDLYRTFPDWRTEILELVAERDLVVARMKATGTHLGRSERRMNGGYYRNVPPTGKKFEVMHTHWYRVRDGKIVEHWASRDDLGLSQQLGLIPPAP